tara:strand:- start:505 stop:645 length:141 start_codon:yes stop_codon:yes gene_type:complete
MSSALSGLASEVFYSCFSPILLMVKLIAFIVSGRLIVMIATRLRDS